MKGKIYFLSLILFLGLAASAAAHQPRVTMGTGSSADNPVIISNPDVSQAFYGELGGRADYYSVKVDKSSDFFLSITAPKGSEADFDIKITAPGFYEELNGSDFVWQEFYEEFGGDWYLQGPEKTYRLIPEDYLITVTSQSGQGKYALIVGTKEEFPLTEVIGLLLILPQLKTEFFGRPILRVFDGKIYQYFGVAVAIFIVIILIIVNLLIVFVRRRKIKKNLTNL